MRVVLFSTDPSVFYLMDEVLANDVVVRVVFPINRIETDKVKKLKSDAARRGIDHLVQPRKKDVEDFEIQIRELKPDIGISWLYSQIIPEKLLDVFPRGVLNMHGGKIPQYRGANVLQWCIINGEKNAGITWHTMVQEVDAGPIWARSSVPIGDKDTAWKVRKKMIGEGISQLKGFWPDFKAGVIDPEIPDLKNGKIWPSRKPEDSRLPINLSLKALHDFLRALCPPWPQPFIIHCKKKYGILGIEMRQDAGKASFSTIPYLLSDGNTVFLKIEEII